jgi:hypothetical protein
MILEDDLYPQSIYVYNDIHFDSICNILQSKSSELDGMYVASIQK